MAIIKGTSEADYLVTDSAGADTLYGYEGDDFLDGGLGNNRLVGGQGHDTYFLHSTGDVVVESLNQGTDTVGAEFSLDLRKMAYANVENAILVGTGDFRIDGSSVGNRLEGNEGANKIFGYAGNDTLIGHGGNDSLDGGTGHDDLDGGDGNDTLIGGTGNDTLRAGGGNNKLDGGDGIDELGDYDDFANGDDIMNGGAGDDHLVTSVGRDSLYGDAGNDLIEALGTASGTYADGGAGNDTLLSGFNNDTFNGGSGNDSLEGHEGDDILLGGAGNDLIDGGDGNDTLEGGTGTDVLNGGLGNNTYQFAKGDGQDTIVGVQDGTLGKLNTLVFKHGVASSEVKARRVGTTLELSIGTSDKITVADYFSAYDPTGSFSPIQQIQFVDGGVVWDGAAILARIQAGVKVINGTSGKDTLTGTDAEDSISGGAGNDSLVGGKGSDTLIGGMGDDTMVGGLGDDVFQIDAAKDVVVEKANEGNDTVLVSGSFSLASLANVENVTATVTTASTVTGSALDNTVTVRGAVGSRLNGLAGNDTLNGGTGDDTLDGGTGNNTYLFGLGDGHDTIVNTNDPSAAKINTLLFKHGVALDSVTYTKVGADLDIAISATDKVTVSGFFLNSATNAGALQEIRFVDYPYSYDAEWMKAMALIGNDSFTGTTGHDLLEGGSGNDTLSGDAGNDTLNGSFDNDVLNGDAGDDTLAGGTGNDLLNGGTGNNTYQFGLGDGQDTIAASSDTTAGRLNTVLLQTGVTPNNLKLRHVGADLVLLLNTTDKLTVANFFSPDANPVQQLQFADTGTIWDLATITANALDHNPPLVGTDGNDTITGDGDADSIIGGAGNDYLYGGGDTYASASDTLIGGLGDDYLDGGYGNDSLVGGDGNDSLNGGDGEHQQYVDPQAGNNQSGYTVRDTLDGGAGDDTYSVDIDLSDLVIEQADGGHDTVSVIVPYYQTREWTYSLNTSEGANIEDLRAGGYTHPSARYTLIGNALDNVISGGNSSAGYTLVGLGGNDTLHADTNASGGSATLIGGEGNDTYFVRAGSEIVENANEGIDTIVVGMFSGGYAGLDTASLQNVERIRINGFGQVNQVKGNALDNVITIIGGGTGLIDGGAGADIYSFNGIGPTTYVFDNVGDNVVSNYSADSMILASVSVDLAQQTDVLIAQLTGSDALNLSGTAVADRLTGNDGDNRLEGRVGNDALAGGLGNDLYAFAAGDGSDTLTDVGGAADVLSLNGINGSQLVFSQVGSDLSISFTGLTDQITVKSWFDGTGNQLETIQTADASVTNQQVNQLIQAMAATPSATSASSAVATTNANNQVLLVASA